MKKIMNPILLVSFLLAISLQLSGQTFGDRVLKKIERRADRRLDNEVDKKLDKVEEGIDEGLKGDNPKKGSTNTSNSKTEKNSNTKDVADAKSTTTEFRSYSKFDFVPGEKLIVFEDFSQDATGDFPSKWNTNASAEIVTVEGQEGKWLALTSSGIVTPDFITRLPENFTLEFDLLITPKYSFYDSWFYIHLLAAPNKKEVMNWNAYQGKRSGLQLALHPQDAGMTPHGRASYVMYTKGASTMKNDVASLTAFNSADKNKVRVSIWRQNQRLRMYVNELKVWDLPRAFDKDLVYNTVLFEKENAKAGNNYFIKDVRLAIGNPDTRNKLLTEGKFSTTGIYFDINSSTIKPESAGVIKEIADVLIENPTLKIKIYGHTDADGDNASNLSLSQKRAVAVKQLLVKEFNINDSRIAADGKGETEPVASNTTPDGKAANRRVEFIRQ